MKIDLLTFLIIKQTHAYDEKFKQYRHKEVEMSYNLHTHCDIDSLSWMFYIQIHFKPEVEKNMYMLKSLT